jgi:hypothetical protein
MGGKIRLIRFRAPLEPFEDLYLFGGRFRHRSEAVELQ